MLFAGIIDGDRVVVDRSIEAKHNHITIAVLDGEYTIKRLYRQANHIELRPVRAVPLFSSASRGQSTGTRRAYI